MTALEALGALAELAQASDQRVPSPCISICRMDQHSALCLGCFRTLDEIIAWGRLGEEEKRAVWRLIRSRTPRADAPHRA